MDMEEMDLIELWRILVKRKRLIICLFILAVVAAGVANFFMEPVYEVSATLMVNSNKGGSLTSLDPLGALMGGSSANVAMQNFVHLLKSRTILEEAMLKCGWESVDERDISAISKQLTVQPVQGTEIIKISMQSSNPEDAQQFVNTLVNVFINATRDSNRLDLRTAREFLADQVEVVAANLEEAEEKLRSFKENERILEPTEEVKVVLQRQARLEGMLTEASIAKIEAKQRIYQIEQKLLAVDEIITSSTVIQENPMIRNYQSRLAELEISLSGVKELYTERHPSVISLQAEINETKDKLAKEVERVIGSETLTLNPIHSELYKQLVGLQVELVALEATEQAMIELQEQSDVSYLLIPKKELELVRLIRDVKLTEEIYIMLMTRNEEIRINEAMHSGNLQIVDQAFMPGQPIKPRKTLNLAIAGVLGLFLGFGLAFLLDYIDNTIKTKEEIERLLDLPVLGQIPEFDNQVAKKRFFKLERTLRM